MGSSKLSNSAVIVIVIVSCLAIISLGAALSRQLYPPSDEGTPYEPSRDQQMYMYSLRQRMRGHLHRESMIGKDLESACESCLPGMTCENTAANLHLPDATEESSRAGV